MNIDMELVWALTYMLMGAGFAMVAICIPCVRLVRQNQRDIAELKEVREKEKRYLSTMLSYIYRDLQRYPEVAHIAHEVEGLRLHVIAPT